MSGCVAAVAAVPDVVEGDGHGCDVVAVVVRLRLWQNQRVIASG